MSSACFCLTYVLSLCLGLLCLLFVTFWSSHWRGGFSWDGSALEFNWHPVLMVSGLLVLYGYGELLCCWSILHYIWYDMCVLFNLPLVDVKGADKGKEMKARAHLVLLLLILPQYHRRDNNNTDHVLPNWLCNNKIIKINVKKKKKRGTPPILHNEISWLVTRSTARPVKTVQHDVLRGRCYHQDYLISDLRPTIFNRKTSP